jgi:[ribosomal protein S5]-alanine N-acetyltransferase
MRRCPTPGRPNTGSRMSSISCCRQQNRTPWAAGWNRYVLLRAGTQVLIGTLGGFPRTETEAEIGYSILDAWQRRGLATEGVRALMQEILRSECIRTLTAQTFPELRASNRVLEKCGFRPTGPGDEPGSVRYRIDRPGSPALTAVGCTL